MKNFQNENSQNKSTKIYERKIGVNNQKIYKFLNEEEGDKKSEKEKEKEKEKISQYQSKYHLEKNDQSKINKKVENDLEQNNMNSEEYNCKMNHKEKYDDEFQNDEDENEINNKNDNHKKKKYNYKYKYKKIKVTEDKIETEDANDKNEEIEENGEKNRDEEFEEDDDDFDFEKIKSSPGRIIHQSTEETYDDDGNRVVTTKTIKEFKQITGGVRIKNVQNEKEKIEYERYSSNNKNRYKKKIILQELINQPISNIIMVIEYTFLLNWLNYKMKKIEIRIKKVKQTKPANIL